MSKIVSMFIFFMYNNNHFSTLQTLHKDNIIVYLIN